MNKRHVSFTRMETVGKNLNRLRKSKRISPRLMCIGTEWERKSIIDVEYARRTPSLGLLDLYVEWFGVDEVVKALGWRREE